jgi:hypothetical protein
MAKYNIDNSDMRIWANHPCSREFFKAFEEDVASGIRELIKNPTHENAEKVKAFQKIVRLIEEARNLK